MNIRPLPTVLLCALVALGPALVGVGTLPGASAAPAAAPAKTRILLAGDSITQGFDGDYTWRFRLFNELRRQRLAFDFVGPQKCPTGRPSGSLCTYLGGNGWDTDHGAKGGTRLDTQSDELPPLMLSTDPDVVIALFGTTDLIPRPAKEPVQEVPVNEELAALKDYVEEARGINPQVKMVLGQVTSSLIPKKTRDVFNAGVVKLAKDLTTPESPIAAAILWSPAWEKSRARLTYDGTHPTPDGEALIARQITHALRTIGVAPAAPQIRTNGLKWAVPWKPSVKVSKRRLVVDWRASYVRYAPKQVRVKLTNVSKRRTRTTGWVSYQKYVTGKVRPGKYKVAIQGRRNTMTSPWSKTYTVRVR